MDLELFWNVLKWVLVVVAAGFVGQFGRHLAKIILERRRQAESKAEQFQSNQSSDGELEKAKDQAKLGKKQAKAEVKKAKKATEPDED